MFTTETQCLTYMFDFYVFMKIFIEKLYKFMKVIFKTNLLT
jgi:hypothetical protein